MAILAYYFFFQRTEPLIERIKLAAQVGLPMMATLVVLYAFFPNFLVYSLFSHSAVSSLPYAVLLNDLVKIFTFSTVAQLTLGGGIFLSAYALYRFRSAYASTALAGILLTFLLTAKVIGGSGVRMNYFLPSFLFLILAFLQVWKGIKARRWRLLFGLLLLVYLVPQYYGIYIEEQTSDLQELVGGGLELIPLEHGRILQEWEKSPLSKYKFSDRFSYDELDYIGYYDDNHGPGLEALGMVNLSAWQRGELYQALPPLVENIRNGAYDAIILGTSPEKGQIYKAVRLADDGRPTFPYTCSVLVPTVEDRCQTCERVLVVLMKDKTLCTTFKNRLEDYYRQHFQTICDTDQEAANLFISRVLQHQGLSFNLTCSSGADLLVRYPRRGRFLPTAGLFAAPPSKEPESLGSCDSKRYQITKDFSSLRLQLIVDSCLRRDLQSGETSSYCFECKGLLCEVYSVSNLFYPSGLFFCQDPQHGASLENLYLGDPLRRTGFDATPCYLLWKSTTIALDGREILNASTIPALCPKNLLTLEQQENALYWQQRPFLGATPPSR